MSDFENNTDTPSGTPMVACDVCLKEIPASAAKNEETSDYVFHFCGIECYAKWKEQSQVQNQTADPG